MMRKKILRLAKIMGNFSLEDIVTTLELNKKEEKESFKCLSELVDNELLMKVSENIYIYNKKQKTQIKPSEADKNSGQIIDPSGIKPLVIDITKDKNYEIYRTAPVFAKKKADKYLSVINAAGKLRGNELESFIKKWNKRFPKMKTSLTSFYRAKYLLMKKGVIGLVGSYWDHPNKGKSQVCSELYQLFKEFYLTYEAISMPKAIELAIEKYFKMYPDVKRYKPPSYQCFKRKLQIEYTNEEIEKFRYRTITIKGVEYIERKAPQNN